MNIFEKLILKHGAHNQTLKAVEEFSELSRAIVRFQMYQDKKSEYNLLEEIADAHIMLEQLKIMCPKWSELLEVKLDRVKRKNDL